jgi:uncharacterized protein (TIGR02466 family)
MNIINFLPLPVYEFTCDDKLIDRIVSTVPNVPFVQNQGNTINGNMVSETDLFYDAELHEWFNSCIEEAKKSLHIPKEVNLEITSCWVNKTKKLQIHHRHAHPNSFMSGTLYLSDEHSGGISEFITENLWWNNFKWLSFANSTNARTINQKYVPQKGKLLLFPSGVLHGVTAMIDNSTRYSIAFNTFFSGPISDTEKGRTRLELKSKSVADHNET